MRQGNAGRVKIGCDHTGAGQSVESGGQLADGTESDNSDLLVGLGLRHADTPVGDGRKLRQGRTERVDPCGKRKHACSRAQGMGDVSAPGQRAVGFLGALAKDECALGDRHARPPGADATDHRVSGNVGK